jgi:hypothetical protein
MLIIRIKKKNTNRIAALGVATAPHHPCDNQEIKQREAFLVPIIYFLKQIGVF